MEKFMWRRKIDPLGIEMDILQWEKTKVNF